MTHHALYRFYDQAGELLYVGITLDPGRRWKAHRRKPWWQEVAQITIVLYPDRPTVLAAERHAIATERPRYNITHNPDKPHRSPASTPQPLGNPTVIVVGREETGRNMVPVAVIKCPHCGSHHRHGYESGHRVAHCSAGRGLGYVIEIPDQPR